MDTTPSWESILYSLTALSNAPPNAARVPDTYAYRSAVISVNLREPTYTAISGNGGILQS